MDQAIEWVQDEASYTLSSMQLLMHHCLQLEKYCRCHVLGGSSQPPLAWTGAGPSMLAEYGIATSEDEDDTPQTQTIMDEMATNLNSLQAPQGTDTLAFWSVSDLTLILSSLLLNTPFSTMVTLILHGTLLHSITCQYKSSLCLPNTSSHQVLRQI